MYIHKYMYINICMHIHIHICTQVTIDLIKEKLEFVMSDADLTQTVKVFTDDPSKKVDLMRMR
jgi:hypothetical protein